MLEINKLIRNTMTMEKIFWNRLVLIDKVKYLENILDTKVSWKDHIGGRREPESEKSLLAVPKHV